jgi:stage V sporulation protein B
MLYGTLFLTATGMVAQFFGFLYRIFLSRLIGAETMGLYQLIMPVYSVLLSVTVVGLTAAVSNLTSGYLAQHRGRAAEQTLSRCLTLLISLLAVPTVLVLLFSDSISVYLLGDARTRLGLMLLPPCVLLTGVENLHKHAFYGAGQIRPPAFAELAEQLVRAVAVLGLLLLFLPQNPERTVGLIVMGMALCEVFSAVTLTLLYRRWRSRVSARGEKEPPRVLNRKITHIALPVGTTALLGNLMGSVCAIIIPQKLVEGGMKVSDAVSAFGVMFGMTLPLLSLPTSFIAALGLLLVPSLAESLALGRKEEIRRRISNAMLATSALVLPAMAFLSVLGPTLGNAMFHNGDVGHFLLPLAIAMTLTCYQAVLSCALNGVGKQPISARNALICAAVELVITLVTVGRPEFGLGGYAVASVCSAALGVMLDGWVVCRVTGLRLRIFTCFTAPGLAALLMGLCVNLLFRTLINLNMVGLHAALICLIFGMLLYLCALSAQGIHATSLFHLQK